MQTKKDTESIPGSKASAGTTWITLLTAVGITATAFVIAKQVKAAAVKAHVEDLVDLCDRAAKTLDDRLGVAEVAYAQ